MRQFEGPPPQHLHCFVKWKSCQLCLSPSLIIWYLEPYFVNIILLIAKVMTMERISLTAISNRKIILLSNTTSPTNTAFGLKSVVHGAAPPVTTPGPSDLFHSADPSPSLRTFHTQPPWNGGATLAQYPLVSLSLHPYTPEVSKKERGLSFWCFKTKV